MISHDEICQISHATKDQQLPGMVKPMFRLVASDQVVGA